MYARPYGMSNTFFFNLGSEVAHLVPSAKGTGAGRAANIGAQGAFVATNVLGLQAGGVSDRMADGIDKIERNTRPLRDADEISFT